MFGFIRVPRVTPVYFGLAILIAALGLQASAQNAPESGKATTAAITPAKLSASFAQIAKMVEPAVVNIDTKGKVPEVTAKSEAPAPGDSDDIMDFFRRQL